MIARLALLLMFIASVSAGGLALLNNRTAPVIAENKRLEQEQARLEVVAVLDDSIRFEEVDESDGFTYWKALDSTGTLIGYAALAKGKGYSSTVETVCGFDRDFNVTGLKVTFQQETPGLGTKIQEVRSGEHEPWFQRQFKGMSAFGLKVKKDQGEIDAITGATISSRAVTNSVRLVAEMIRDHVAEAESHELRVADKSSSSTPVMSDDVEFELSRRYNDEEAELDESEVEQAD